MYADIKLTYDSTGFPRMPVTFVNKQNTKSIIVNVTPDTGTTYTVIDDKYARLLGMDITSGKQSATRNSKGDTSFYKHLLGIKIGNLKEVYTFVDIGTGDYNIELNLLGMETMLQYHSFIFNNGYVRVYDAPSITPQAKLAAAAAAYSYSILPSWKKRI